jgi:DNA (cytosine-5)-methyltransferase 1
MSDQQRAMAWDVLKWAEWHRPSWVVVENVIEFEHWGPLGSNGRPLVTKRGATFEAWVKAIQSLGYTVDWRRLNAANYGAATSRVRLFVVARKGRRSIPWPEPTHSQNTGGELPGMELQPWRAAWEIIDWSKPCPSIFDRKRPLADKTLLRIEAGLRRFCSAANVEAFIAQFNEGVERRVRDLSRPLGTIKAGGKAFGLVTPFTLSACGGGAPRGDDHPIPTVTAHGGCWLATPYQFQLIGRGAGRSRNIENPVPSIIAARENHGIVLPFFVASHGERDGQPPRTHDAGRPLPTIATSNAPALAVPYMVDTNHGGEPSGRHYSTDSPLGTISTHNGRAIVQAFLTKYYGTAGAQDLHEPLDTITAKHRHGLVMAKLIETMGELGIVDIGFRMLDVDELARATGFREDYTLCGTKADRTRQIGNAVPPPFAAAITREIAAA